MGNQDEIIELAKLGAMVNGEMRDLASKTDPDGRRWIPIRGVNTEELIKQAMGRPSDPNKVRSETVVVRPDELPAHLRPVPIEHLLIQPEGVHGQTARIPDQSPTPPTPSPQLELGLSFEKDTPFSQLLRQFSDMHIKLNRIENKLNMLLEKKNKTRINNGGINVGI